MLPNVTVLKGDNFIDTPILLVRVVLQLYKEDNGIDVFILNLANMPNEKAGDIRYNGVDYKPIPFKIDFLGQSLTGNNKPNLTVSNAGGILSPLMRHHGRLKEGSVEVRKMFIRDTDRSNLKNPEGHRLDIPDSVTRELFHATYTIEHMKDYSDKEAVFKLCTLRDTGKNIAEQVFSSLCPFDFKDMHCGYVGEATTCKKTLADCRKHGNSMNFAGVLDGRK